MTTSLHAQESNRNKALLEEIDHLKRGHFVEVQSVLRKELETTQEKLRLSEARKCGLEHSLRELSSYYTERVEDLVLRLAHLKRLQEMV